MSSASAEKQDLLRILHWSSFVKIIFGLALAVTLIISTLTSTLQFNPWPIVIFLLPFFVVTNTVLWLIAKRQISWAVRLIYPEIFLNILIITLFVYFSGESHVNFLFLYVIPAFSASLVSLGALVTTFVVSIVFFGIEHYIVMTPGKDLSTFLMAVVRGKELGHFFLLTLIISAIGFQARYYVRRIKETDEKLMKIKDEFLFRTIHDLRGPASAVRFIVEKYQNYDLKKCDPAQFQSDMKTIGGLNKDLLAMVEDLLQVAKGEQADVRLSLEPIDLKKMIASILLEYKKEISRKDIKMDYASGKIPLVSADRLRLREVFANLVENAVKYNRTGGFLAIRHETKGNFLISRVENTSIDHLSPEDLEKFFKPYAQIGQDEEPGNGLGLYIVKKLVEKMGGEVGVSFDPGKDKISFHVSLPIAKN